MFDATVRQEDEMSFSGGVVPEGRLEEVIIQKSAEGDSQAGNKKLNMELIVTKGTYAGTKTFDDWGLTGSPQFITMGKMKASYTLEHTRQSHEKGPDAYKVNSHKEFEGMRAIVKFGIEIYRNKDGVFRHKNVVRAYGSPRSTSRNHELYAAWARGDQPFQTDEKPPLPNTPGGVKAVAGAGDFNDPCPF